MSVEQLITLLGSQGLAVGLVVWAVGRGLPLVLDRFDRAFARMEDGQHETTAAVKANTAKLGELHVELVRQNRVDSRGACGPGSRA